MEWMKWLNLHFCPFSWRYPAVRMYAVYLCILCWINVQCRTEDLASSSARKHRSYTAAPLRQLIRNAQLRSFIKSFLKRMFLGPISSNTLNSTTYNIIHDKWMYIYIYIYIYIYTYIYIYIYIYTHRRYPIVWGSPLRKGHLFAPKWLEWAHCLHWRPSILAGLAGSSPKCVTMGFLLFWLGWFGGTPYFRKPPANAIFRHCNNFHLTQTTNLNHRSTHWNSETNNFEIKNCS